MSDKYYFEGADAAAANKESKRGVNSGLILFLIGVALTSVGGFMCHNTDLNKYLKTKDYNNAFKADKVQNLYIDNSVGDFDIKKGSGNEIKVVGTDVAEDFTAELSGDTLNISSPRTKKFIINVPMLTYKNTRVEITLPEKEYEALTIKGGVGDIDLSDVKFGDITYETGTGDNDFKNVTCDTFNIANGTGDNKINNLTCNTFKFIAGTGDMTFSDIDCKGVMDIESGVGDTKITNTVLGGFDLNTGTGDFEFEGTINGDITIDSGVGDLEMALTNPETDFGKNGKYKMSIDKGTGDKDITYNN